MKSAGKARNNGLYRHIRTSKEIIRNLLNDFIKNSYKESMAQGDGEPEPTRLISTKHKISAAAGNPRQPICVILPVSWKG